MQPDLFDLLTTARDKLDEFLSAEKEKQSKLDRELLLANCLALLKDIPTTNLSHDKRLRLQGLRFQITEALRGAA